MVMPGGMSPDQAMQALEVGDHVSMEIIKYPNQSKLEVRFIKINSAENFDGKLIMEILANQLREQMFKYFRIKGKMITQL